MKAQREYAIIDIAPDGQEAFNALESRMKMPLAANDTGADGDTWWFASRADDGSERRAFAFQSWQRIELAGLMGVIATPGVRFSVGYVDIGGFRAEGPGAARTVRPYPPVLLPHMIDQLYAAAGRRRLR